MHEQALPERRIEKDAYCTFCGAAFPPGASWPRTCAVCGSTSYRNPLPVAVTLVPVEGGGLLLVRRAIEPKRGMLALPGGYIGIGESWQQAGAREVQEETAVVLDPERIQLFDVQSAPDGTVLIFGLAPAVTLGDIPTFAPNSETSEIVVARKPTELAFSLHTRVANRWWSEMGSRRG